VTALALRAGDLRPALQSVGLVMLINGGRDDELGHDMAASRSQARWASRLLPLVRGPEGGGER
jgi:hypothetical protein